MPASPGDLALFAPALAPRAPIAQLVALGSAGMLWLGRGNRGLPVALDCRSRPKELSRPWGAERGR